MARGTSKRTMRLRNIFAFCISFHLFITPLLRPQGIDDFERKYEEQKEKVRQDAQERKRREMEWQRSLKTKRGYPPRLHAHLAEMVKVFEKQGIDQALEYGRSRGMNIINGKIEVVLEPEYGPFRRKEIDFSQIQAIEKIEIRGGSVLGPVVIISLAGIKKISDEVKTVSFIRPFIEKEDHRAVHINCFSREGKEKINLSGFDVIEWQHPLYGRISSYVKGQIKVLFVDLVPAAYSEIAHSYGFNVLCHYLPLDSALTNVYLLEIPAERDLTEIIEQIMHDPHIDSFYLELVFSVSPIEMKRK